MTGFLGVSPSLGVSIDRAIQPVLSATGRASESSFELAVGQSFLCGSTQLKESLCFNIVLTLLLKIFKSYKALVSLIKMGKHIANSIELMAREGFLKVLDTGKSSQLHLDETQEFVILFTLHFSLSLTLESTLLGVSSLFCNTLLISSSFFSNTFVVLFL